MTAKRCLTSAVCHYSMVTTSCHPSNALSCFFHVRMAAEERRMLEALAEEEGISASDWVRMTIRRSFTEHFNQRRSKRKAKP
jgi:predicted HicB family RNase H-like nuclease